MTRITYQTDEWGRSANKTGSDYIEVEIAGNRVMIEITDNGIEIIAEAAGLQVTQIAANSVKMTVTDIVKVTAPINRAGL